MNRKCSKFILNFVIVSNRGQREGRQREERRGTEAWREEGGTRGKGKGEKREEK